MDLKKAAALGRKRLYQRDMRVAELHRTPKKERPRCGARTRSGEPCQAPAVEGGERCRIHGGVADSPRSFTVELMRSEREELRQMIDTAAILASGARHTDLTRRTLERVMGRGTLGDDLKVALRAYATSHKNQSVGKRRS